MTSIPPQESTTNIGVPCSQPLLNVVSELPETDIIDSPAFKAMISGDQMTARHIREAPFSFRARAAHIFAANKLPGTTDMTPAFWRRLVPIMFNRRFPPHQADTTLADRIVATEMDGIFAWAVAGAVRLLRRGHYDLPASSVKARDAWKRNADQVRLFADEHLQTSTTISTIASEVYRRYVSWAQQNRHCAMASNKFGERLHGLGFTSQHKNAGSHWHATLTHGAHGV